MVATTGAKLLPGEAIGELVHRLLRQTTVLTPNIPEARLIMAGGNLGSQDIVDVRDLETMGRAIHNLGPKWVLIKGGHCPFRKDGKVATTDDEKEIVVDVLYGADEVLMLESPYQDSKNTHGTGCSLACQWMRQSNPCFPTFLLPAAAPPRMCY